MSKERIEVRHLETMQHLVTFFELSEGEIKELFDKYPFPDGRSIENFKLTPSEAADWFEVTWRKANPPRKIGQFRPSKCAVLSDIKTR
jgi:hypothetical protein